MPTSETAAATVTRTFDLPAERVFDAWIAPEIASRWLFSTPDSEVVRSEFDVREGGTFVIVDRRADGDAEHRGRYLEVRRPERLVFEFDAGDDYTRVEVDIAATASGCTLTVTHHMATEWAHFAEQAAMGWNTMLGKMAAAGCCASMACRSSGRPRTNR